jgi:hypothetical protein
MADPFADLIPQGGSEQGNATPALATTFGYKDPEDNGVGAWGDVTNRPDVHGVSLPIPVLKQQFGDPNKAHGQLVKVTNPETGQSIVAPIVDKGPADWVVARQGNTIDLTHATNAAIGGTGKTPVTYSFVGKKQQSSDPFSDLIPQQQETNAPAQASEQVSDPFADLIPQQQERAQATPSSVASTAPIAQNAPQVAPEVEPPAEVPSSASKIIGGIVSPFGYIGQEGWNAIAGIQRTFGYDQAANESAQIAANSVEDWANTFGGTAPEQGSAAETAGKIGGAVVSFPALAMTGLAGAGTMIASGYGNIKEDLYNKYKQQGLSDQDANNKSTTHAAVTTIATLPAYILGGKAAGKVADKFIADSTPKLIDATARFGFNTVANSVASAVVRGMSAAMEGEDPYKAAKELTLGGFVQDAMFAGHSVAEHFKMEARKGKAAEEITKVSDAMLGVLAKDAKYADIANKEIQRRKDAVAPQVAPSANPVVNQREQQILNTADSQFTPPEQPPLQPVFEGKAPETPAPAFAVETPSAKAPVADLTSLILDQTLYDEGSPEWNAIQAQIDALKKPSEAPASGGLFPVGKKTPLQKELEGLGVKEEDLQRLWNYHNRQIIRAQEDLKIIKEYGNEEQIADAEKKLRDAIDAKIEAIGDEGDLLPRDAIARKLNAGTHEWNPEKGLVKKEAKPAEAPAEAQPKPENAVQIETTGEVGVRNAPAVGEGVGAENKPEVPAKEAEATKEEVKQGEVPDGYIEEGLHQEYPNIGEAVDKYSSNNDATGIGEALADESYDDYYSALQSLLKRYLGDNIIVSRKEGYAGGSGEGVEQYASVSTLPTWRGKKYIIPREDVVLAGNEAEGELIVKRDSLKPYEEKPETKPEPVSTISEGKAGQEEVKPTLPKPVQDEFTTFARKQGGLNKAQAQKALIEYEKAGNIKIGEDGQFYFTKGEHSSRESLRKAAGIEEAPQESPSSPIRDILRRFQSGEEDSIDTLKGLADSVSDAAKKTKNKHLADLASEIQDAVDAGVEIGDAQALVNRTLAALESEANRMEAPKEKKTPAERVKTRKDKAREVFGDAAEGLSYVLENKILDPAEYRKRVKAGIIQGGGEYDFFYNHKFPRKVRDLIFSRTGRPIDIVSDDAGFKNPYDLLVAIDEAHRTAEASKEQAAEMEKRKKALEENIRKMAELEKTNPDAHAAEVESDVRKYLQGRMRGEGGYFTLPEIIYDAAVSVGRSVAKGARDFKSWSGEMVNRLGEGVRNFLHRIYNAISTGGGRFLERGAERGAIDLTGEERFKPKPPTEQEAFAKKAADAILKGRGTPITQDELANVLARKFPGISSSEVADLYATASGRPKPPAPYAGIAATAGETPEQISIRKKDQADQVKRGILTSVVDTAQGLSDARLIERGRQNLANGVDPNQALEKARQGDAESLSTARAYFETVLAPRASELLKTKGPKSPEYIKASREATEYYQGIREGLSVASEALRTAKGQVDLTDASAIAREYTIQTGEEPTLSQHDQIRKVADKVDKTIKESDKASEEHKTSMDQGLADVEVNTPETVEEGRQQVADLSDAQGKKAKEEIDRLNNELEQTKRDLEEIKQAKATGQDPESLKAYYEAKLKDLNDQLASQPKYGKEVFETARKIVDKWKADATEAEKLLRKQLNQMGSSPDPTIILTLARIMRAHIGELALDFTESSARLIEKFGPKIKPFLKDAWAKAQELIKGEDGGENAVKSVRKGAAKSKPVEKMTPAEKAADSLRRRIAQAQKKIDDINSGKITTPKEVEKVTNEEIQRLESEYSQKKKELSDARLKAKQKQLFEKGKVGEDLNPEQVKTLWESAKKFYLDKGESDYDKMISDLASDFGLTPAQVRKAFASPKGAKRASDEMYLKQRNRQMALDEAKRWLDNQKASWIGKVFGTAAEKTFKLAIFGHGTAFIGTHAPQTLYTHPRAAFKAWLKGLSYSFRGKSGRIQNIVDNKDLINRPNWIVARKGGLENDPREIRREGATPTRSDTVLAKALDTISGGRGFDALFHLRQDIFDQAWNQLSITQRTPEMAEMLANNINNATGFTKGGKRTAGILQSPITKVLFFAPKLIASRFKWLIQDPARMIGTFAKMATPFAKVTPEERMSAVYEAKNKAKFLGVLTGTLLANQALLSVTGSNQSINFTDPKKNDWLAYKGFGYNLATVGAFTRIARLLASEYNAVFGDLSRWQKAKGGREQAMKDALYTYLRSGLSPITRDIIVASTGKDYVGNTVPWSSEQPDRGRRKLTWREIIQEQFAPIPISEAATQKEILPAAVKAGSAAFLGTRLETPADIEEYEKSLKSKAKPSGGLSSSRGLGKGL